MGAGRADADGKKVDVDELVDLIKTKPMKKASGESTEMKEKSVMEGKKTVQVTYEKKFENVDSLSFIRERLKTGMSRRNQMCINT